MFGLKSKAQKNEQTMTAFMNSTFIYFARESSDEMVSQARDLLKLPESQDDHEIFWMVNAVIENGFRNIYGASRMDAYKATKQIFEKLGRASEVDVSVDSLQLSA